MADPIKQLLGRADEPDRPSDGARARMRTHVLEAVGNPPRPRRWPWLIAGILLGTAATATWRLTRTPEPSVERPPAQTSPSDPPAYSRREETPGRTTPVGRQSTPTPRRSKARPEVNPSEQTPSRRSSTVGAARADEVTSAAARAKRARPASSVPRRSDKMGMGTLAHPRLIAQRPDAHCWTPRWSPDGQQLAYDVVRAPRETWIVHLTDGRAEAVEVPGSRARERLGGEKRWISNLAWAPDMRLFAKPYVFAAGSPTGGMNLHADGTWLTASKSNDRHPAWSPDGRLLAFHREGEGTMYIDLSAEDTTPRRVTPPDKSDGFVQWSPRSNQLAFVRNDTSGKSIGVYDDVTSPGPGRMLTDWPGSETQPSWSPDGRRLAFYRSTNHHPRRLDLWVMEADGQRRRRLATHIASHRLPPTWTPDGTTILFAQRDPARGDPLRWVRQDGRDRGTLKTGLRGHREVAVFDDGQYLRVAFGALGRPDEENYWHRIYVMQLKMSDLR